MYLRKPGVIKRVNIHHYLTQAPWQCDHHCHNLLFGVSSFQVLLGSQSSQHLQFPASSQRPHNTHILKSDLFPRAAQSTQAIHPDQRTKLILVIDSGNNLITFKNIGPFTLFGVFLSFYRLSLIFSPYKISFRKIMLINKPPFQEVRHE